MQFVERFGLSSKQRGECTMLFHHGGNIYILPSAADSVDIMQEDA